MLTSTLFLGLLAVAAGRALPGVQRSRSQDTFENPILYEDFPDNDISLGPDGAYYFSASNFHYSPGAPILRSYDLVDWEFVGHSIPRLEFGDGYDLPPSGQRAYRGGTWASTLRYRKSNGLWYWIGCTNFWNTWIYTAPAPEGPWTRRVWLGNEVCYYDLGLLIDDDDTMYVVYTVDGGRQVNVTQLSADGLSPVRSQGVLWPEQVGVDSVEGNRLYKINGTYYILNDRPGSTAYVWKSSSPWGPYEGKPLADNVPGPVPGGGAPHQGSLIPTPSGDWYFMSFTWAFPSGRLPVLAPIEWQADGFPTLITVNGTWGKTYPRPRGLPAKPLRFPWTRTYTFSNKTSTSLPPTLEWNHNPDISSFSITNNALVLRTATVTNDLYSARNTLTHRVHGEYPKATLKLDVRGMKAGDRAGLAAFRDQSSYVAVEKTSDGGYEIVGLFGTVLDEWGSGATLDLGREVERVKVSVGKKGEVWFRLSMDARPNGTRQAKFEWSLNGKKFTALKETYELYTGWPFFLGYRFGIFNYATKALGGEVKVLEFKTE